jgi:LmbE family N-acetylglucosaminyl deacetylase
MMNPPTREFGGRLLILAPHMDDESLGCGLLIATHPDPSDVHVVFVTDGSRSPEPHDPGRSPSDRLPGLRQSEALAALQVLGVPAENARFLGLPDGSLSGRYEQLEAALLRSIGEAAPDHVFVPFRYDWHPDHVSINRAVCAAKDEGRVASQVVEYFVYSQRRLMPHRDIRACLPTDSLHRLDPSPDRLAALKRRAIECHRTQTTCYFDWQTRPILTEELVDRVCAEPEVFHRYDPARPGWHAFAGLGPVLALAARAEPRLKRWKDSMLQVGR